MINTIESWRVVLDIFAKYADSEQDPVLHGAEHDEIWGGPDPSAVSEEDLAKLDEQGWHPDEGGCFHRFA